jgi:hypothetical protein
MVAAFAGVLLGIAGVLMLELSNRRVRSTEDITHMLDLPVLGRIRKAPMVLIGGGRPRLTGPGRLALGSINFENGKSV